LFGSQVRSAHIWRGQDDPNFVVLAETYDSREAAEADATNPAMLEAMERDGVDLASVTLDYLEDVGSLP
jgi:quinol monooxygenase YgiN